MFSSLTLITTPNVESYLKHVLQKEPTLHHSNNIEFINPNYPIVATLIHIQA